MGCEGKEEENEQKKKNCLFLFLVFWKCSVGYKGSSARKVLRITGTPGKCVEAIFNFMFEFSIIFVQFLVYNTSPVSFIMLIIVQTVY